MTSTVQHPQAPTRVAGGDVTLRDWLRSRPSRAVHLCAAALVVVQLGIRGWAAHRGYFSLDDFLFMGRSVSSESLPHYLFTSYNGHLMPGALLIVKLLTAAAPLQFGPVVVLIVAMQAVASVLVWRVLARLCGPKPALLVPFAVYLFSMVTLPAFLWYAAAINQLPMQIAMVGATLLHVRYLQEGRRRDAFLAVGAVALGLLFYEKTVLTVGLLFLLTALYFSCSSGLRAWRETLWDHRVVWAAHAGVLVVYTAVYLSRASGALSAPASADTVRETVQRALGSGLLPAMFGGPWTWHAVGYSDSSAAPSGAARLVALLLAAVVLELSLLVGRRPMRAWSLLGVYVVTALILLVLGRGNIVNPDVGGEYRYLTDIGFVAALAVALAFLGTGDAVMAGGHGRPSIATPLRRVMASPAAVSVVLVGLIASSTYSLLGFADRWAANPAKPFVTSALRDAQRNPGAVVADIPVPANVVWPLLFPYNKPSRLLAPSHPPLRYDDLPSDRLVAFTDAGRLATAYVEPGVANKLGSTRGCGWKITPSASTRIPLEHDLFSWRWAVRMGYIADRAGTLTVTVGSTTRVLAIERGLHAVFWYVNGNPASVTVTTETPRLILCTNEITVGRFLAFPFASGGAGG